jgi:HEAT repeat protein/cyclophilin family peptidyl-prolyl cis-trans isomerase
MKRFELRMLAVCMLLLGAAATWLLLTRPIHRIEGDFLAREDQRQVDEWLGEKVVSSVGDTRRRAMLALGRIGDPQALELVIAGTADPSPRVRAMAAFAIGQIENSTVLTRMDRKPSPKAIRALYDLLSDTERVVVSYAVEALGKLGRQERFEMLLRTPAPLPITLVALVRMQAKEAAPWIVELLRSDDQDVRRAAVSALNRLEVDLDEGLTKKLIKRSQDRNEKVRVVSLKALVRAKSTQRVLCAVLAATKDRNPQVRIQAYTTLGLLRPSGTEAEVAAGLQDTNINVRIAAVRALGVRGDRHSLQLVQPLRFQSDPLSYAAEEATARLADSDDDYFTGFTGFPPEYQSEAGRESFLRALDILGSPRAQDLLRKFKSVDVRLSTKSDRESSQPRFESADYQRISRELNRRLIVHTTIGAFELIVHYDKARLTAEHFLNLVRQGAFESQRFVTVHPTRAVEFRAARPLYEARFPDRVRCEVNTEFFTRGSLGMFADPKDTGGYRFFIALADISEFDGRYTNFGRLVSGDNLISSITRETKILNITGI